MDADHVDPMEQVLAERAVPHLGLQVLVGGGDDPDIHLDRGVAADPIELAVGQHPKQPGLGLGGHVADFVQEKRAAMGLLETTLALGLGAGKGAFFVPEQFRFHQVLGNRGHVQGDECPRPARAVPMQGARHKLLAGTGLAVDQHRDIGIGEPADGAEDLLHRGGLADDFRHLTAPAPRRIPARGVGVLAGTLHQLHRFVHIERLGQVLEGAALVGGDGGVQIRMGGNDDHRQIRPSLLNLAQQLQAVDTGHADVGDQHIRPPVGDGVQGAVAVFEAGHGEAALLERLLQHPADGAVVVDHPDVALLSHLRSPGATRS